MNEYVGGEVVYSEGKSYTVDTRIIQHWPITIDV